jgi:hypothetical protein
VPASPAPSAPPARPAYVAETHWDATAGKIKDEAKFAEEINANAAAVAAERSRKLTLPQTPDAYKDDLPATFTPPAGLEFKVDTADPLIAQYRTLAHKAGLDQATYSEGLGLIAALRVGEATQMKAAYDGEVAKLGAAGPARIDAAVQWLNAMGGAEAQALTSVMKVAPVASTVVAIENLMKKFTSQGITPMNNAHRADAAPAGKIAGYEKMSFEQRRLAQDQQRARAAGR